MPEEGNGGIVLMPKISSLPEEVRTELNFKSSHFGEKKSQTSYLCYQWEKKNSEERSATPENQVKAVKKGEEPSPTEVGIEEEVKSATLPHGHDATLEIQEDGPANKYNEQKEFPPNWTSSNQK